MISLRSLLSALALSSSMWLLAVNAVSQETEAPAPAEQPAAEPAAELAVEPATESAAEPTEDDTPSLIQLTNPAIADQLGLTNKQREIIAQVLADRVKQLSEAGEDVEQRAAVEAGNDARLLEVFSDEQRRRWEAFAAGEAPLEPRLRFNFSFQPWVDVLEWFADQADLSLVLDAPPRSHVTGA